MSENSLLSSTASTDKNPANGGMIPYRPSRRRLRVSRALSHAKDEKAFQDAVRTGKFTERELQTLEEEFQKVHRRRPRRP
jgi:hypothetical protein